MQHLLKKLKPILLEIENSRINEPKPVTIEELLPIFEKYSGKRILRIPLTLAKGIKGIDIGAGDTNLIFHHKCSEIFNKHCSDCQMERFSTAKELVHTLDEDGQKTKPEEIEADYLENLLLKKLKNASLDVEYKAELGAIELLVPYYIRKAMIGSMALVRAKNNDDYTDLCGNFCVPEKFVRIAFSDENMGLIKACRKINGMD
jgi:Zn-dependent peptidase ImmA (M78 family)